MMDYNCPSNSNSSRVAKTEAKRNVPVKAHARTTKTSSKDLGNAMIDTIKPIARRAMKELATYALNAVADVLHDSLDTIFAECFPEFGKARSRRNRDSQGRVSYHKYYDNRDDDDDYASRNIKRMTNALDYDHLYFGTRREAEEVLDSLDESIRNFGVVSINELYETCDIPNRNSNACKYGWSNLESARIVSVGNEYVIRLPRASAI